MNDALLSGIRVLDLTNVLAGPYCTYQLMLYGAEVLKIEVPGQGDLSRQLGEDDELNAARLGASFLAQNAGKKSIELDLKTAEGAAAFRALVSNADVLVENFRPGVMGRLGLDWAQLRELNPGLIYCAISGFGQEGPMSSRPAYDQIIQGYSGMMSVTGAEEFSPLRVGFPICDTVGGLTGAAGINAALVRRYRTGEGCFLDVSMLEASAGAMGWAVSNFLTTGRPPHPMGNDNATAAPSGVFETADGLINIAANQQAQFVALCRTIGRDNLVRDVRFTTASLRKRNRKALSAEINDALKERTAEEWEEMLAAQGVPAGRILSIPEMTQLPQLRFRRFFADFQVPGHHRAFRVSSNGVRVDNTPLHPTSGPPRLGEHTKEVLSRVTSGGAHVPSARLGGVPND